MSDRNDSKPTFTSFRSLLALPVPTDKPHEEYGHAEQPGFFVRVMRRTADGKVRRTYLHRYKITRLDENGVLKQSTKKEKLGLVEALDKGDVATPYETALKRVLEKRTSLKKQAFEAITSPRLTLEGAFAFYGTEKPTHRAETVTKDTKTFERYFSHIKHRFLDELKYPFWSDFVKHLREGTLVVGHKVDDAGVSQPVLRGPCAPDTLVGIMNVAILLYQIGQKYEGLQGVEKNFCPPREAKKLIGDTNKRKTKIALKDLGRAWNAADQLCAPWWRDLFRMYVLTGLRRSLMVDMKFSEIDWKDGSYVFPPTKVGSKRRGRKLVRNSEPIRLPLSKAALDILRARQQFAPDPDGWVWYAPKPLRGKRVKKEARLADPRSSWVYIENSIGDYHFAAHDLRRTFATVGGAGADDVFAISLLLLHSSTTLAKAAGLPEITVDYIQTEEAQKRMRRAAEQVAAYVQGLARGDALNTEEPELPRDIEEALAEEA